LLFSGQAGFMQEFGDKFEFIFQFTLVHFEILRTDQFLDEFFFHTNMRDSYHHMFAVIVDSQEASSSEFNLKSTNSFACLEEVPGIDKQMKRNQVALQETFDNLKPVFVRSDMSRAGKWRVEEKANVGLRVTLPDIERHHDKMVVVYPDRLGAEHLRHFNNLLPKKLVDSQEIFPVF